MNISIDLNDYEIDSGVIKALVKLTDETIRVKEAKAKRDEIVYGECKSNAVPIEDLTPVEETEGRMNMAAVKPEYRVPIATPEAAPMSPEEVPDIPLSELDKDGIPWDSRIHSSNQKMTTKGVWQRRRGLDEATFVKVKAELKYSDQSAGNTVGAIPTIPPVANPLPLELNIANESKYTLADVMTAWTEVQGMVESAGQVPAALNPYNAMRAEIKALTNAGTIEAIPVVHIEKVLEIIENCRLAIALPVPNLTTNNI